jgi:hypothetical protein
VWKRICSLEIGLSWRVIGSDGVRLKKGGCKILDSTERKRNESYLTNASHAFEGLSKLLMMLICMA